MAECRARKLSISVPLLGGGHVEPPAGRVGHLRAAAAAAAAVIELGVGEGDGAERMTTLEAQDSQTVLLPLLQ